LLTCVNETDGREYTARAADTVRIGINALWSHTVKNVPLRVQRIFDHVPIAPALIRHWLRSGGQQGGLMFPVPHLDMESSDIRLQILKHTPGAAPIDPSATLQIDLHIIVFRRDIEAPPPLSTALEPFDATAWRRASAYGTWRYMHAEFAPVVEEELDVLACARFPSGGCALFRRMMRAHYGDCSLLFGKLWVGFGLGTLLGERLHDFMRHMLLQMFLAYHAAHSPPPPLPPCYNAATVDPGQRVCAECLTFMLGHGQMKRCPCHQVRGARGLPNADREV
jgi:hypothetical protein